MADTKLKERAALMFKRAFRAFGVWALKLIARVKFGARAAGETPAPGEAAVILCSHSCIWDFSFLLAALSPRRVRFVATSIEFEKSKPYAWMLNALGVIKKKQGAADIACVRAILRAIEAGDMVAIYAAGMTSFDGRPAWRAQNGTEKLLKLLGAPVYSAITRGGFISHPRYAHKSYRGKVEIEIKPLFTREDVRRKSAGALKAEIESALNFNDWDWQERARVKFKGARRTQGLTRVLYRCPNCAREGELRETKRGVTCIGCGMIASRDEYGWFHADNGASPRRMDEWFDAQLDALKAEWARADMRLSAQVTLLRPSPGGAGYKPEDKGELALTSRALSFAGSANTYSWSFDDFQYFVLNDVDFVHIYARDGAYRFKFDDPRLITKWFLAHKELVSLKEK